LEGAERRAHPQVGRPQIVGNLVEIAPLGQIVFKLAVGAAHHKSKRHQVASATAPSLQCCKSESNAECISISISIYGVKLAEVSLAPKTHCAPLWPTPVGPWGIVGGQRRRSQIINKLDFSSKSSPASSLDVASSYRETKKSRF